jgi:hypothetical protein
MSRLRAGGAPIERTDMRDDHHAEELVEELDNVMRLLRQPGVTPQVETRDRSASELDAALAMVSRAAEAMDLMEDRSRQVQVHAEALADQARRDVDLANEKAATLQRRLVASEARAEELIAKLEEAEQRARAADEWLALFHDTITSAFSTRQPAAAQVATPQAAPPRAAPQAAIPRPAAPPRSAPQRAAA